jgi:hypothetical protein
MFGLFSLSLVDILFALGVLAVVCVVTLAVLVFRKVE